MTEAIEPVLVAAWLDGETTAALNRAAAAAQCTRASYLRRLIGDDLRAQGYLEPLPIPRRRRGPRRKASAE